MKYSFLIYSIIFLIIGILGYNVDFQKRESNTSASEMRQVEIKDTALLNLLNCYTTELITLEKKKKVKDSINIYSKHFQNPSDDEIDSVIIRIKYLEYIQRNMKPATIAGTSYIIWKKLNDFDEKELRKSLKSYGVHKRFIKKVPKKFSARWLRNIRGSKRLLIGIIGGSATVALMDNTSEPRKEKSKILPVICGFLFLYFFYVFLQKNKILN